MDEVVARLDGEQSSPADSEKLMLAVALLFDWFFKFDLPITNARYFSILGKRVVAAAWVINPNRLAGDSLKSIAKQTGISPVVLSRLTADFTKKFKISNHYQKHDWKNSK